MFEDFKKMLEENTDLLKEKQDFEMKNKELIRNISKLKDELSVQKNQI
jgi:hypothetical protein